MGLGIGLLVQLIAIAAAAPAELKPTTPWRVEYADNMCVLSRGFGGTGTVPAMALALRPLPLSTRAEWVIATSSAAGGATRGKVKLTLLPSGEQQEVPFERRRSADGRALTDFEIPATFLDAMQATQAIDIAMGAETPVRLVTGPTAKGFAALTPCQDDLLRGWGYDPAVKDKVASPAAPVGKNFAAFFSHEYYPREALDLRQAGRVTIAWTVDADGKARDCRVLGSSGAKSLDLTTCAIILQKVRFKPALDHENRPMASYSTLAVRWAID